jgi:hypothetical protein
VGAGCFFAVSACEREVKTSAKARRKKSVKKVREKAKKRRKNAQKGESVNKKSTKK